MKNSRDIIRKPLITEKGMNLAGINKYTFEVAPDANKVEIRKAVEDIFNVTVTQVHTLNIKGKFRRVGAISRAKRAKLCIGYTNDWKKAVVTLKAGDKIQVGGVNLFEQ